MVFSIVAVVTASLSAAQKRAEMAQRRALDESREALRTLRKVSDWPVFVDSTLAGAALRLLEHAASVVGAAAAVAVWEVSDEPWFYVADSGTSGAGVRSTPPRNSTPSCRPGRGLGLRDRQDGHRRRVLTVSRHGAIGEWRGPAAHQEIAARLTRTGLVSAPFSVEHLSGRLFFNGLADASAGIIPLAEVVSREVGNSLERLHLHDRLQQIAIREDRLRVARDLHDGVLQSLTGIRFRLQALADEQPIRRRACATHCSRPNGDRDRTARTPALHRGPAARARRREPAHVAPPEEPAEPPRVDWKHPD